MHHNVSRLLNAKFLGCRVPQELLLYFKLWYSKGVWLEVRTNFVSPPIGSYMYKLISIGSPPQADTGNSRQ